MLFGNKSCAFVSNVKTSNSTSTLKIKQRNGYEMSLLYMCTLIKHYNSTQSLISVVWSQTWYNHRTSFEKY